MRVYPVCFQQTPGREQESGSLSKDRWQLYFCATPRVPALQPESVLQRSGTGHSLHKKGWEYLLLQYRRLRQGILLQKSEEFSFTYERSNQTKRGAGIEFPLICRVRVLLTFLSKWISTHAMKGQGFYGLGMSSIRITILCPTIHQK